MSNFFDKLTGKDGKNNKKKPDNSWIGGGGQSSSSSRSGGGRGGGQPQFKNPFANIGKGGSFRGGGTYRGGGQSLGGSRPGRVISVSLPDPGPLGMKVEKRPNSQGTAIVSMVEPNTQASAAGLQRGDIPCWPDTNGEDEIMYSQFLDMAKSDIRPLRFDVRRIDSVPGGSASARPASAGRPATADAYAKRQAVIAAAEARDKAHKAKTKPVSKKKESLPQILSNAEKRRLEEEREARAAANFSDEGMTAEARRAVEAAKNEEARHAAQLGYNPYETARMGAGQARTATVAMTHGTIDAKEAPPQMGAGGGGGGGGGGASAGTATSSAATAPPAGGGMAAPGAVRPPSDAHAPTESPPESIDPAFDEAYLTVIMSNADHGAVVSGMSIMRKLIVNATTKGQTGDEATSAKFRRVRLTNPKIKAAITDVHGALELMMSTGFVLSESEEDGETYLVYPPGETGPFWLGEALRRMEQYEKGS